MWTSFITTILGIALTAAPRQERASEEVAPGIHVLRVSEAEIDFNFGWVEMSDHVVLVDAASTAFEALAADVRRHTEKPIRYAVQMAAYVQGRLPALLVFAPIGPGGPEPGAHEHGATVLRFDCPLRIDDGLRTLELVPLGNGTAAVWLPSEGVLFTGPTFNRPVAARGQFMGGVLPGDLAVFERLARFPARMIVPITGATCSVDELERRRIEVVRAGELAERMLAAGIDSGDDDACVAWLEEDLAFRGLNRESPEDSLRLGTVLELALWISGRTEDPFLRAELGLRDDGTWRSKAPGWKKPRRVLAVGIDEARRAWLARAVPGVEVIAFESAARAAEVAGEADGVIGACTSAILGAGKRLAWIQVGSAGVERYLGLPELAQSKVVLTNAQRLYGPEIAEHAIGLLLALTRGLTAYVPLQSEGKWDPDAFDDGRFIELRGKTLLVVGLGGIGTEVARLAHGLGMRVVATRASSREGPDFVEYVGLSEELLALAKEADVIVNCTPLTKETEGLFDGAFFAVVKPTAFFLNVGRGKSVDTDALVKALVEKRLAGAGLDVTEPEPLPADHPLWRMPNVVITPHVSAGSDVRSERYWVFVRENLRRFVAGEPMLSVVDKERGY